MADSLNSEAAVRALRAAAERALPSAAKLLLDASNRKVPVDTGNLERSGDTSTSGLEAAVSYGTDHAVIEHENMTAKHSGGRQAKFLESAMHEQRSAIASMLADRIRQELK